MAVKPSPFAFKDTVRKSTEHVPREGEWYLRAGTLWDVPRCQGWPFPGPVPGVGHSPGAGGAKVGLGAGALQPWAVTRHRVQTRTRGRAPGWVPKGFIAVEGPGAEDRGSCVPAL